MINVTKLKKLAGFKLRVEFSDGTSGVADLSAIVREPPFKQLQDRSRFQAAVLEYGAVEWPSEEVGIATEALYALVHNLKHPETFEDVKANETEVELRELRKLSGRTQKQVARELDLAQGNLSRFERSASPQIDTLKRYIRALGGDLELVAVIKDRRVPLSFTGQSRNIAVRAAPRASTSRTPKSRHTDIYVKATAKVNVTKASEATPELNKKAPRRRSTAKRSESENTPE